MSHSYKAWTDVKGGEGALGWVGRLSLPADTGNQAVSLVGDRNRHNIALDHSMS